MTIEQIKATISPQDIPRDAAFNAHCWSSHVPDVRAEQERRDYANMLLGDLEHLARLATTDEKVSLLAEEFSRYREGFRDRFLARLAADSRTASSMVTGPANFPVERNRKALAVADRRQGELMEYRERALEAIRRKLCPELAPIKLGDSDAVGRLREKLADRERLQARMKELNQLYRKSQSWDAVFEHCTEAEKKEILGNIKFTAAKVPFPPFAIRNNGAEIRRLEGRIVEVSRTQAGEEKTELRAGGMKLVERPDLGRIQLVFPGKPDEATREKLKESGFRWAPSEGAWQRHLNDAGRFAAERVLKAVEGKEA